MNTSIEGKETLLLLIEQVNGLLYHLERLDLLPETHRIQELFTPNYIRVGVVGEFSRGKSTLINQLIGEDILPVGALSTTQNQARVCFGTSGKTVWIDAKGSISVPSISDFDVTAASADAYFVVEIPNERLQKSNLQFIDTPGAGDLQGEWFEQTVSTLSDCDIVLMVISAMMPLSQTEQKFVEQQILAKQTPRLGIVLTWLDQASVGERDKIIQHIRLRIEQIAPQAIICTVQDVNEIGISEGTIQGIEPIFQLVEQWAASKEHPQLKAKQIKARLFTILQSLEEGLVEKQRFLDHNQKQEADEIQIKLGQLNQNRVNWEELNLKISDRKKQTLEFIRREMEASTIEITGKLQTDLNQSIIPKQWLDTSLPAYLEQELRECWQMIAMKISTKLRTDLQWLETEVLERLSWQYSNSIETKIGQNMQAVKYFPKDGIQDISQVRKIARLGGTGVAILGIVLYSPISIAIGLGSVALGEWHHHKNISQQKQELMKYLGTIVDYNITTTTEDINRRVEQAYGQIIQEIHTQENTWYATKKKALERENILHESTSLKEPLQTIKEIKKQLI
jgi:small GTP-binding protein